MILSRVNSIQSSRKRESRTRSKFIKFKMQFGFQVTLTKNQLDQFITRAIEEGIGDWCVIDKANKASRNNMYTVPIQIIDIETNQEHLITRSKLLTGIRDSLMDFPYVLDTKAGFNLSIDKLTKEDIDEIIQIAAFKEMKYGFI